MSYHPFINSYITYDEVRYTFYWYGMFADHILRNQSKDTHGVDFATIVKIVRSAGYSEPVPYKGPDCYRFVTAYQGKTYETFAYLMPADNGWPPRCVVITCYKDGTLRHKIGL